MHTHIHTPSQGDSAPILVGGGGGGGGGGLMEPAIYYDSGNVVPTLAAWVYVRSTRTGILFARNTFEKPTKISVFAKQLADVTASVVSLTLSDPSLQRRRACLCPTCMVACSFACVQVFLTSQRILSTHHAHFVSGVHAIVSVIRLDSNLKNTQS